MPVMEKAISKLLGLAILLASLLVAWFVVEYQEFAQTPFNLGPHAIRYEVPPGSGLKRISHDLAQRGIIQQPTLLVWMGRWQGKANRIKAGEYELTPDMKPGEFLDRLVAGEVVQYALTFVEGWSFRDILKAIRAVPEIVQITAGMDPARIMEQLGLGTLHPEGQFYPDTYHFTRGTTDLALLARAHRAMVQRLDREWKQRASDLPYDDPYQALIMASIIEKETGQPQERAAIAGVFIRRLQRGMSLQTDPTVIYGLGETFDGNLRRRDLRADTPYNTYVHKGLPPTPIAMPGGDAIHAAMHPAPGEALYFVARGDGSHQFSNTLTEHNKAVIKYQLGGKPRAFSSNPGKGKPDAGSETIKASNNE